MDKKRPSGEQEETIPKKTENSDDKKENSDNKKENSDNDMESSYSHLNASRNIKREKAILKEQTPVATDGSGEGITETKVQSNKIIYSRKRRSDEYIDTVAKKPATSEQVQSEEMYDSQAGSVLQIESDDDKIKLEEKDFSRMSQQIGNNFMLLGLELGITSARIEQIIIDYPREVCSQIFMMLKEWKKIERKKATLRRFLEAMKHCTEVNFQQPQLNKILLGIRKRYGSEGGKKGSCKEEVGHENDDKIIVDFEDLRKISNHVGKNWRHLGSELGVSETRMDHFEDENSKSTVMAINEMLKSWKQENFSTASLKRLQQAMKRCPAVRFDKTALNKIFEDKRNQYQNRN